MSFKNNRFMIEHWKTILTIGIVMIVVGSLGLYMFNYKINEMVDNEINFRTVFCKDKLGMQDYKTTINQYAEVKVLVIDCDTVNEWGIDGPSGIEKTYNGAVGYTPIGAYDG